MSCDAQLPQTGSRMSGAIIVREYNIKGETLWKCYTISSASWAKTYI